MMSLLQGDALYPDQTIGLAGPIGQHPESELGSVSSGEKGQCEGCGDGSCGGLSI